MKFIDEAKIEVIAGHGGPGSVGFRREKYVPMGGADGGDGGKGGDIIFLASHQDSTLQDFRYQKVIRAKAGEPGRGACQDGRKGDDLYITVPVGTVIYDEDDEVIADFTKADDQVVVAKGGRGGKGNAFFVTSTRQSPKFAQPGEPGDQRHIRLELKLLADVGLVGLPNAGKSTLLSVVSNAKPKIADYPFTTLKPCLGVVAGPEGKSFVMADLPGLIEGAHEGKGMGDQFLKHAERTKVLIHCISLSPEELQDPMDRYKLIMKEIKQYGHGLSEKPQILLLTKADLVPEEELAKWQKTFKKKSKKHYVTAISSVTQFQVASLVTQLLIMLKK